MSMTSKRSIVEKKKKLNKYDKEIKSLLEKKDILQANNQALKQKAAVVLEDLQSFEELYSENKSLEEQLRTITASLGLVPRDDVLLRALCREGPGAAGKLPEAETHGIVVR